jgi:hypothetical protein
MTPHIGAPTTESGAGRRRIRALALAVERIGERIGLRGEKRRSRVRGLADGRVLVVGGSTADGPLNRNHRAVRPRHRHLRPTGSMTVARYWPSLALLPDGRVLIVGFSAPDGSSDGDDRADLFQ